MEVQGQSMQGQEVQRQEVQGQDEKEQEVPDEDKMVNHGDQLSAPDTNQPEAHPVKSEYLYFTGRYN